MIADKSKEDLFSVVRYWVIKWDEKCVLHYEMNEIIMLNNKASQGLQLRRVYSAVNLVWIVHPLFLMTCGLLILSNCDHSIVLIASVMFSFTFSQGCWRPSEQCHPHDDNESKTSNYCCKSSFFYFFITIMNPRHPITVISLPSFTSLLLNSHYLWSVNLF